MTARLAVLTVDPIDRASGTVRLPGSKSISNRALLLSALANGETSLIELLHADDTRVMRHALSKLGVRSRRSDLELNVHGCDGSFRCGTAPLTRQCRHRISFADGGTGLFWRPYELDGTARMRQRPIGDLVDALNSPRCVRLATRFARFSPTGNRAGEQSFKR